MGLRSRLGIVVLSGTLLGGGIVDANTPAQAALAMAQVNITNGIPNTPVDVYINGKIEIRGIAYTDEGAYPAAWKPGRYTLAFRRHGAAAKSAPILTKIISVASGEDASVVTNLTAGGSPTVSFFVNPTTPGPPGGRVIIRDLADAPPLDIYFDQKLVATALTNSVSVTLNESGNALNTMSPPVYGSLTGTSVEALYPMDQNFLYTTTIIYLVGSYSSTASTLTQTVQDIL